MAINGDEVAAFDRRDPGWRYMREIERDQGAVLQLALEGIALVDAAVVDRPGADCGCAVAGAIAASGRAAPRDQGVPTKR